MLIPAVTYLAALALVESSARQVRSDGSGIAAARPSRDRPEANQLLPGTKRCPDGSILRAVDRCVEMPDHRFEMTHEPLRQVRSRRWWCSGSPNASQFEITLQWIQPRVRTDAPTQVTRLGGLLVKGQPASATLKTSVQQQLDSFHRFDDAGARCLAVRSGGTIPVLTLHGVTMVDGKLKSKHEEILLH